MEVLTILFNSLIMSVFLYIIEVWACPYRGKYIKRIDKFCRRAGRFNDLISQRDIVMWKKIIQYQMRSIVCTVYIAKKRTG